MTWTPDDAGDLAAFLHDLDADLLALELLVLRAFEPRDDGVGDVDAGHVGADPLGRARRGERADAGQDEALFVQPEVAHPLHEGAEERHVEAVLRLRELRAGRDLLGEPQRAEFVAAAQKDWRRRRGRYAAAR